MLLRRKAIAPLINGCPFCVCVWVCACLWVREEKSPTSTLLEQSLCASKKTLRFLAKYNVVSQERQGASVWLCFYLWLVISGHACISFSLSLLTRLYLHLLRKQSRKWSKGKELHPFNSLLVFFFIQFFVYSKYQFNNVIRPRAAILLQCYQICFITTLNQDIFKEWNCLAEAGALKT